MSSHEVSREAILPQSEAIDLLATALRFYRSLLRRKWVVMGTTACTLALAAFYYVTATRLYESKAELIVLNVGGNVLDEDQGGDHRELDSQMPNFERVLQSDRVLKSALKALPKEHLVDFMETDPEQWIEQFRKRMSVNTLRNTNSIVIGFRSVDPETAYLVVDSLLTSYLSMMNSMHQNATQDLLRILQEEKIKAETEMRAKEAELLALKEQSQVLFSNGDRPTNVLTDRVIELNKALVEAKKVAIDAKALYQAIQAAVQNGEDLQSFATQFDQALGSRILETHMGVSGNDSYALARIQQDMLEVQAELSKLLQSHGPNHPQVRELQERMRVSEQFIAQHRGAASRTLTEISSQELGPRLLEMARRRFQVTTEHEAASLQAYLTARDEALKVESKLNGIIVVENELTEARNYYNILLDAIKNKSLVKESGIRAEPITPPRIDRRPVTPKLASTAFMGLMAGLFIGCLAVYTLDFVDDRFHSPDDLRQTLNVPILAMIRKLPVLAHNGLESLYPYAKPNSVESEAFRTLRTAIEFDPEEPRRITISSTEPSDGKTTVMASLGVTFAQAGKRTLMIDGDMRRPGLTRLFNLTAQPGLSTILKDDRPAWDTAPEYVVPTGLKGLDVIPAGPRPINPVELLTGERLAELIAWAENNYDQLLIDAPPSLAVADVQVIGRLVDAALLTVRPDKNRRKMVIRAGEALTSLGCNLLGIVVNHVEPKHGGDYAYGYGYGYGYGEGYGHDQHEEDHHGDSHTIPLRRAA
ncbi:MAG: polysaccharide biosynthesis tyrosine autokinase [Planctomycetaceae bacterium]|nr:polysaccharide biosynthesis tyrosine autokinase [Planctomycetaceae bacterium]